MAARLGGEEFGILLPDTPMEAVYTIAEEIRLRVEAARIPLVDGSTVTSTIINIGIAAQIPTEQSAIENFIASVDANLYAAKKTGRNRIYPGRETIYK
jgi:diguanylate cyclase (GGDEF)-like protein